MISFERVGIIGAGSYGTAIAQCFGRRAKKVLLISNEDRATLCINESHTNPDFIPGVVLSENISCSGVFSDVSDCDIIFIVTPTAAVESVCRQLKQHEITAPTALCSKGFCNDEGKLQSTLFEEILDNDYAIFSGPSFAGEIAAGLPAAVNIASKNGELSGRIAENLSSENFKIEPIGDYIGLQTAGALKNVLAIACGIFFGLKLGNSAVARLITEGLNETARLSVALGGQKDTIFALGGVGDTILTCTCRQSRNMMFGEHLAAGGTVENRNGPLAEGVFAVKSIPILEQRCNIRLKIFSEIYKIICDRKNVNEAVADFF